MKIWISVDENSMSNDTNISAPPEENKENNTNEEEFVRWDTRVYSFEKY